VPGYEPGSPGLLVCFVRPCPPDSLPVRFLVRIVLPAASFYRPHRFTGRIVSSIASLCRPPPLRALLRLYRPQSLARLTAAFAKPPCRFARSAMCLLSAPPPSLTSRACFAAAVFTPSSVLLPDTFARTQKMPRQVFYFGKRTAASRRRTALFHKTPFSTCFIIKHIPWMNRRNPQIDLCVLGKLYNTRFTENDQKNPGNFDNILS